MSYHPVEYDHLDKLHIIYVVQTLAVKKVRRIGAQTSFGGENLARLSIYTEGIRKVGRLNYGKLIIVKVFAAKVFTTHATLL